jgi:pantothenate kinase type III
VILFADCGNTAIKLALGDERVRLEISDVPGWIDARQPTGAVVLATGKTWPSLKPVIAGLRTQRVGTDLPLPDQQHYASLGLDRRVAAFALMGPAIVIDAGTATTLTAWKPAPRCFAGGLILPSSHVMAQGLAQAAPALPVVTPLPPDATAAQQDTTGAIAAAIGIGHPAMVAACLARLQAETGITQVVLTGHGAPTLIQAGIAGEHRPWLVLEGLQRLTR